MPDAPTPQPQLDFPKLRIATQEDLPTPDLEIRAMPPRRPRKVEPEHIAYILQLAAQPMANYTFIIDELEIKYGYRLNKGSLSTIMKTAKKERAEIVAALAMEGAGEQVRDDITMLQEMKQALYDRFQTAKNKGDDRHMVEIGKELRALTAMLLDLGGARTRSIKQEGEQAKESLIQKFRVADKE
jgi:hypothetical protein